MKHKMNIFKKENIFFFCDFLFLLLSVVFFILIGEKALLTKLFSILLGISVIFTLFFYRKQMRAFFFEERLTAGLQGVIQAIIIFFITLLLYLLCTPLHQKIDFTAKRIYSLSDQSIKIIQKIDSPVKIYLFRKSLSPNSPFFRILQYEENIIREYAKISSNIELEILDPVENPVKAFDFNVKEDGEVIISYDKKIERLYLNDFYEIKSQTGEEMYLGEVAFSGALARMLSQENKNIYVITGHGERDFFSSAMSGYAKIKDVILKNNIEIKPLSLIEQNVIPNDAAAILIANPSFQFTVAELDKVNSYLAQGGSLIVLIDLETNILINDILKEMGVLYEPNLALDETLYVRDLGRTYIVPLFQKHDILKFLIQRKSRVLLPTASAIQELPKEFINEKYTYQRSPLLSTSKFSYGETSLSEIQDGKMFEDEKDIKGPLNLSYAVERFDNETKTVSRLFVVGDSDFINNQYYSFYGNSNFFLNGVYFSVKRDIDTGISPKVYNNVTKVAIVGPNKRFILFFSLLFPFIYILPFLFFFKKRRMQVKHK